jgi:hypothetical protein
MRHPFCMSIHKGSLYEGTQLFTIQHQCEECGVTSIVYLGPAEAMPLNLELAEALVLAEDSHVCPVDEALRQPY